MSLVICDYLINMAYLIFAMVHWLQKLCLLVVIVSVDSEQEGSNRSLVTSASPTWNSDIFFFFKYVSSKLSRNGENLEGCDFHVEVEWIEVNFPFPGFEESPTGGAVELKTG